MKRAGRSVRLYLAEGTATGILTAEIGNWTGHALAGPRTRLDVALARKEMRRTGVYILYGDGEGSSELPSVYVGEGDDVGARLRQHAINPDKDYWDRFVVLTSKDMNLTKAHVRFLEAKLIGLLSEAKKSEIRNGTAPQFDLLPEADISDMEVFLDEVQLLLPVIGFDLMKRPAVIQKVSDPQPETPVFVLTHSAKGLDARAKEVDGEFVLLSGSRGSLREAQSFHDKPKLKVLREQVLDSGRAVRLSDDHFQTSENIAFGSPSAAAVFLFGTARNGRTDWRVESTGQSYGEWSDEQLSSDRPED